MVFGFGRFLAEDKLHDLLTVAVIKGCQDGDSDQRYKDSGPSFRVLDPVGDLLAEHVREAEYSADNERSTDYVVDQKTTERQPHDAGHHVNRRANADKKPCEQHDFQCMSFDCFLELLLIFRREEFGEPRVGREDAVSPAVADGVHDAVAHDRSGQADSQRDAPIQMVLRTEDAGEYNEGLFRNR